jgi:hypothetical protein
MGPTALDMYIIFVAILVIVWITNGLGKHPPEE